MAQSRETLRSGGVIELKTATTDPQTVEQY